MVALPALARCQALGPGFELERSGKYAEAATVTEEAVALSRAVFGSDHPAVATARYAQARAYDHLSRYDDARDAATDALEIARRSLGPEHPRTVFYLHQLALLIANSGGLRESETLLRSVVEISSRTLGESSQPIDASGSLPDGTKFVGPLGLKQALLTKPDQFVTTLTEKLMVYAIGRGLAYTDAPTVRSIVRESAKDDYRISAVILGIARSAPFQMRRARS